MCLKLKWWNRKRIATKDIVVYKVVVGSYSNPDFLQTPYQRNCVSIGKTYSISKIIKYNQSIYEGFHSFEREKDARELADEFVASKIVICIIPKGSIYYKGRVWRYKSIDPIGYTSDSIKYVKIII